MVITTKQIIGIAGLALLFVGLFVLAGIIHGFALATGSFAASIVFAWVVYRCVTWALGL